MPGHRPRRVAPVENRYAAKPSVSGGSLCPPGEKGRDVARHNVILFANCAKGRGVTRHNVILFANCAKGRGVTRHTVILLVNCAKGRGVTRHTVILLVNCAKGRGAPHRCGDWPNQRESGPRKGSPLSVRSLLSLCLSRSQRLIEALGHRPWSLGMADGNVKAEARSPG